MNVVHHFSCFHDFAKKTKWERLLDRDSDFITKHFEFSLVKISFYFHISPFVKWSIMLHQPKWKYV